MTKPQFENLKFEAWNEEHSVAIQKELFKLGYEWIIAGKRIYYSHYRFLYCGTDGVITRSLGSDVSCFLEYQNKLSTLAELKAMSIPKEDSFDGKVAEIEGKKYKLTEVE